MTRKSAPKKAASRRKEAPARPRASRVWRRLRRIEALWTPAGELRAIAEALRRIESPTPELRNHAADWLDRLAGDEVAIARLCSAGRGRRRGDIGPDVALDFCVQRELVGGKSIKRARGSIKRAGGVVAKAWGLSDATVADYWTDHGAGARVRLQQLIQHLEEYRPRRELLEAVSADLREHHARKK